MAEDINAEGAEVEPGGGIGKLIFVIGVVLVAAIAGLSTYLFLLKPMLDDTNLAIQIDPEDMIPMQPVTVEFPETPVNVMREGEMCASTLLFGVTLECENPETAELVNLHRARFVDMINKLHDSRTRAELDDTLLIKESIQAQILQRANSILQRVQAKPSEKIRITDVFHHRFVVSDCL